VFFQASTIAVLGDRTKLRFWKDAWLDGRNIVEVAPDLVATVSKWRQGTCIIASALQDNTWIRDITGP
jgi:hypothetical protein